MLLSSFARFWQICTSPVLTSGADFHFVTESNNSLLAHAEAVGKQEHGAPQGPQQRQPHHWGLSGVTPPFPSLPR